MDRERAFRGTQALGRIAVTDFMPRSGMNPSWIVRRPLGEYAISLNFNFPKSFK